MKVEHQINAHLGGQYLEWEGRLVSSGTHMGYPYGSFAGDLLGVLVYAVGAEVGYLWFFMRRWRTIRGATHSA
ncbi:hypothetical protein ABZX85_00625 [Streptomyces sp. NPDC004539]|uniref:hypothetical protein n=1 Tax=Streptomyces sp. NPDC004539 TaxID=3154280 RepID=UPI0033A070C7